MLPDKKMYSNIDIAKIFEMDVNIFNKIAGSKFRTFQEGKRAINEFHKEIKIAYRKIVKKYHPDHGGNENDFKVIQRIYEALMKIDIKPISRPKYVFMNFSSNNYTDSTTTSTTTSW